MSLIEASIAFDMARKNCQNKKQQGVYMEKQPQPKFKLGEVVCHKLTGGRIFPVGIISQTQEGFLYGPDPEGCAVFKESGLELFQEPKKKKLHAYRVSGCLLEVRTFMQELEIGTAEANNLHRVPDWDIGYPEEK